MLLRRFGAVLLRLVYRIEIRGREHYDAAGPRALIVVNHTSYLDAPLLVALLPDLPSFAINPHVAAQWWVRPWLGIVDVFRINSTSPISTRAMIRFIRQDRRCVIFPEGRITQTGSLMKIYEGPGVVADHADAAILPIRIDGAQYTPFSRLKGKFRLRWFPKITLTVLPPTRLRIPDAVKGRARREIAGRQLYDIMSDMVYRTGERDQTLFGALLDAAGIFGRGREIVLDVERTLTYDRLIVASLVLGRRLAATTRAGHPVGLLLPNAVGTVVAFFALQAVGRPAAVLNFSAGEAAVASACRTARLEVVLTSRRFVELGRLEALIAALQPIVRIVYLEDLRDAIGALEWMRGLVSRLRAAVIHRRYVIDPDGLAVLLFTSGTEGAPKGVALSHRNILANCRQLAARVDFAPSDTLFNALPLFHSFGLTAGLILPVTAGVRCFLYPSPLHYRIVPEMVYSTNATILFGTDTFLAGYARAAHAYDFYSVRYVFAGAEKLKTETRNVWATKFGIRILEGYGATEASPVLSVNTPLQFKAGSVGRLLPSVEHRIEPVDGLDAGGVLHVRGPNIMLGYMRADAPGAIQPVEGGWYDTGDVVDIDADGFVTILDRVKRFAKVAGEMVSLGAVEDLARSLWPEAHHAAIALADSRRGEQVALLTTEAGATRDALLACARRVGAVELMVPKRIVSTAAIPVLPSGKTDYRSVRQEVLAALDASAGERGEMTADAEPVLRDADG
jgi:Acyl-CoA synthetases (AMP-forming)/AMP-acid ligases II